MKDLSGRSCRPLRVTGVVICSLLLAAASADAQRALRHDPFALPPALRPPVTAAAAATTAPEPSAAVPWQPRLQAVVVGARGSMALVEGSVIALGEEFEGHRLVHVAERRATFMRNGVRVELKMDSASAATR